VTSSSVACAAWFVDLLLPRRCVSCGASGTGFCASCRAALRPLVPPLCARCGAPTAWPVDRCRECAGRRLAFASARSAYAYAGPASRLLRAWKERGHRQLAGLAGELVATSLEPAGADVVTSIPADPVRQLERSRHPAEALARELGTRWELEYAPLLRRDRIVQRQAALAYAGRRANVQGAFAAKESVPARILLVDDIYTTGSTASVAASALRRAGATRVDVVTFARAVR
jgi:predicted amidophosphoribosyltransferase